MNRKNRLCLEKAFKIGGQFYPAIIGQFYAAIDTPERFEMEIALNTVA